MRRVVAGAVATLVLASVVAAGQQRGSQRPVQNQPRDEQRGDTRGGPPQGPPQRSKWWQDEKVKAELRLAPEQSARIEEIFDASFAKMKDVYDDLNRREEQLSNLISGNDVTEAQLLKQADQVEAIRSTLSKSRTLMLFRMRRVLSADQRSKLVDIQKAQERERRGGRPPEHSQTTR
jgi:Spy/CpxP family protein refolding chaperone